jgi:hypothetical protein
MIAYNLCYCTCVGKVAHAQAALAAGNEQANVEAQQQQQARQLHPQSCTGGGGGGGGNAPAADGCGDVGVRQAAGVRLGCTTYVPPYEHLVPEGRMDPNNLVSERRGNGGGGSGGGVVSRAFGSDQSLCEWLVCCMRSPLL